MKNTFSHLKPIKLGKRLGTTYCLRCKDYTHNFRPQKVNTTNKVFREKSNCMVCRANKSRFLKQKRNKKVFSNYKIVFSNYKTCICIVKTIKNIQVTRFQRH